MHYESLLFLIQWGKTKEGSMHSIHSRDFYRYMLSTGPSDSRSHVYDAERH